MRDLVFTSVFVLILLAAIGRPWIGVLLCAWLGYMSPHRLCYGFAAYFPFFAVAAAVTIASIFISSERKRFPWARETFIFLLFVLWMNVTTLFALNPPGAWFKWDQTMKTMLMIFLGMLVMAARSRLHLLVWVIVLSIEFYGVKGGIFAILTGAQYTVQGPPRTMLENNNALAIFMAATLPLMRYLQLNTESRLIRQGLGVGMGLTAIAILASYSRGGFLALCTTGFLLLIKSRRKWLLAGAMIVTVPLILSLMPQEWFERMDTISEYKSDSSAMGRLEAWQFAINMAADRPLVGGGFKSFTQELFAKYIGNTHDYREPHSIFFEVLGEHGYPGLFLFLLLGVCAWRTGTWIRRVAFQREDLSWAGDLAAMSQVALASYAVGGATSTIAYFDLPYHLMAILMLTKIAVIDELRKADEEPEPTSEEVMITNTGAYLPT